MSDEDATPYAHSATVEGLLQRGRGVGAVRAAQDPHAHSPFVLDGIDRDWRWDGTDDRALYLARLFRDLELSPQPVVDRLAGDKDDCLRAVEVLELLALDGSDEARAALRSYVATGPHWVAVLESFAFRWPVAWWEDLGGIAHTRLARDTAADTATDGDADGDAPCFREPWARFGIEVPSRPRPPKPLPDGLGEPELLAVLADSAAAPETKVAALRALRRQQPTDAVLPLVPSLGTPDGRRALPALRQVVEALGVRALPAARAWARDERPWPARLGADAVADHPGPEAIPGLVRELAGQWAAREWCGPDRTARRLAKLGVEAAAGAPYLRRFWLHTPHSYERAAYLEALASIAPSGLDHAFTESLWDCEEQARELAVERAPGSAAVLGRIAALRDDPMETAEVRAAAATRLVGGGEVGGGAVG